MLRIAALLGFVLAAAFGAASPAFAQACPTFQQGVVLTAAQWQACFNAKQNALGYTPVNKAGDSMLGRLVTVAPGTTAGLNLMPGSTPSTPADGDIWITTSGAFARVNGGTVTLGGTAGITTLALGGTNAALTASNGGIVYSTASAMAILSGTVTAGQCLLSGSNAAPTWGSCSGGGAAVSSVAAANTTLTISPTTGSVVAGINLGNANDWTAAQSIAVTSATAFRVGLGTTNPALLIDTATGSSATGIKIKSAAAAGGVAISAITSGTNEPLTIDAAGSGTITLGGTSTGAIIHTRATTLSAALTYGGVTLSNSVSGTGAMALSAGTTFTGTTTTATLVATTVNGNTLTAGTYTLTGVAGKTLTFNKSITLEGTDSTTMTFPSVSATITRTVASGAKALATGAITSATCTTAQTATATGTLTTDAISASFNGDPTAVTGYVPLTSGMLTIMVYPTADTVNFKVCNNTAGSVTPGAITINWSVLR